MFGWKSKVPPLALPENNPPPWSHPLDTLKPLELENAQGRWRRRYAMRSEGLSRLTEDMCVPLTRWLNQDALAGWLEGGGKLSGFPPGRVALDIIAATRDVARAITGGDVLLGETLVSRTPSGLVIQTDLYQRGMGVRVRRQHVGLYIALAPGRAYEERVDELGEHVQGMRAKADFPCDCRTDADRPLRSTVKNAVIHLNDDHKWTRERIADWLDELHTSGTVNLTVSFPQEEDR